MSQGEPESLRGRTFRSRSLRASRFLGFDLGDVVVRGSDVAGMEIDSPWLVMATDTWLGKGILEQENPYHPLGLPNDDGDTDAYDETVFRASAPTFAEVLDARSGRQTMVREYLADATPEILAQPRKNPHDASYEETVLSCLRTILEEEWEHHRYAVRDLDTLAARSSTQ